MMQELFPHFVEHRRAPEVIGALEKLPYEIGHCVAWSHRIAHRDPRAALDGVHDEAAPVRVEEQRLVAQVNEVGIRGRLCGDGGRHRFEVRVGRHVGLVRRVANQPRDRKEQHHRCGADRSAQCARGFTIQLELPPQVL